MHTYITDGTVYTVGFLMVEKTNGIQSFVPMFDVPSRHDAVIAVNVLNGGGPTQAINITKEYHEAPLPAHKDLGGL